MHDTRPLTPSTALIWFRSRKHGALTTPRERTTSFSFKSPSSWILLRTFQRTQCFHISFLTASHTPLALWSWFKFSSHFCTLELRCLIIVEMSAILLLISALEVLCWLLNVTNDWLFFNSRSMVICFAKLELACFVKCSQTNTIYSMDITASIRSNNNFLMEVRPLMHAHMRGVDLQLFVTASISAPWSSRSVAVEYLPYIQA